MSSRGSQIKTIETQRAPEQLKQIDWAMLIGLNMLLGVVVHAFAGALAIVKDVLRKAPVEPSATGSPRTESPAEAQATWGSWLLLTGLVMTLGGIFRFARALADGFKSILQQERNAT
ncbi:hypothetical protein [Streptomyces sp. NPDC050534]|uniref:hypothetical protein n=1 Tax=Streptomyces sp. NPDC050534 TaxID=3365625 RepID=UPI0037B7EC12